MSDLSKSFSRAGILTESTNVIYLQNIPAKKAVINFLRLVRKVETNGITFDMNVSVNGSTTAKFVPVNMAINDGYMLDLLDDSNYITLKTGDYISMSCNLANSLDFILSGELHEDL